MTSLIFKKIQPSLMFKNTMFNFHYTDDTSKNKIKIMAMVTILISIKITIVKITTLAVPLTIIRTINFIPIATPTIILMIIVM